MPRHLTDQIVRALPVPERGYAMEYDSKVKGFACRVTASGVRSFTVEYRPKGSRNKRRYTIGKFPDWSVPGARDRAKVIKRMANMGQDSVAAERAERNAPLMRDLWTRYESEHLSTKAARSRADERAMFRDYILPSLGPRKVAEVKGADVDDLHRLISREKPVRANRVIEVLRKAFNLAIRWDWREDNPAAGVRRNPEEPRHRYLSPDEQVRLMAALDECKDQNAADAIRLLALTGARRGEVLSATWDQFDLDAGLWTKPSSHTKQRRLHRVPLSSTALELLRRRHAVATCAYVFPSPVSYGPMSEVRRTWLTACRIAGITDARIHDLRHSFASTLVSNGHTLPVIGAMLGHTQAQTTMRYSHLFDDPLRLAAEQVGKTLAEKLVAK